MKLKCLACILAAALLLLVGCGNTDVRPHHYGSFREVIDAPGSRGPLAETLEELEERVPNIVRGRIGSDARIVYQFTSITYPDRPTLGHNRVSLEILEVIQGDLRVGETICILEPYYIFGRTLFTWANYMPSIPYQEYIFFLGYQLTEMITDTIARPEEYVGAYYVRQGEFGRFPVLTDTEADIQNFSANDLSLGRYANIELYLRLWQDVLDAFIN